MFTIVIYAVLISIVRDQFIFAIAILSQLARGAASLIPTQVEVQHFVADKERKAREVEPTWQIIIVANL
jgi:hypothetical protein